MTYCPRIATPRRSAFRFSRSYRYQRLDRLLPRAERVGGTFTVLVYGSGVSLVAAGSGSVRLAGVPDTPRGDGVYSLNDEDFTSLPGIQTGKLLIGDG